MAYIPRLGGCAGLSTACARSLNSSPPGDSGYQQPSVGPSVMFLYLGPHTDSNPHHLTLSNPHHLPLSAHHHVDDPTTRVDSRRAHLPPAHHQPLPPAPALGLEQRHRRHRGRARQPHRAAVHRGLAQRPDPHSARQLQRTPPVVRAGRGGHAPALHLGIFGGVPDRKRDLGVARLADRLVPAVVGYGLDEVGGGRVSGAEAAMGPV
ncbi:hypothetical protein EDC01DRAFT_251534 [Geopyxis carbonaria]|nr:hypothetical protein EDC01DRAFT_251534 [Geopyxis carbonaria]